MINKKLKNLMHFTERITKNKAIGIIYNVPKQSEVALLASDFNKNKTHIVLHGTGVATSSMLKYRLGYIFNVRHLDLSMLPNLLDGKMLVIYEADFIKESFARAMEELSNMKIPLLLIFSHDSKLSQLRNFGCYNRVMTIEYDYENL